MALPSFVESIAQKYIKEEVELESKLKAIRDKYQEADDKERRTPEKSIADRNFKRAQKRNKALLKDLELVVAKLRTQTCYSPTEIHLEKAKRKYLQALAEINARKTS